MAQRNQEAIIKKLEKRQENLNKFIDAIEAIAARELKMSSDSLIDLSKNKNPTKACASVVNSGTSAVAKEGIKAVEAIARLNKDAYEFDLIIDFLRDSKDEDESGEEE